MLTFGVTDMNMISGEFVETHKERKPDIDYDDLKRTFKTYCVDFEDELVLDRSSEAVEFCTKMIFEVEPSLYLKRGTENLSPKCWKFVFTGGQGKHTVFVVDYKQENMENGERHMIISLTEAGLLARVTFSTLISLGTIRGAKLMTPIAITCFNEDDIAPMAGELGIEEINLLIKISFSTHSGGHYSKSSDVDIAVCASVVVTRHVKDEGLRKIITAKVLKQYLSQGHIPNQERMDIISKYIIGGVPDGYGYEELSRILDQKQIKYNS